MVGIRTKLRDAQSEFQIPAGKWDFLFSKTSRPGTRPTQPHSQWAQLFFSGVKRPGCNVGR
jgi:hypothetical protein